MTACPRDAEQPRRCRRQYKAWEPRFCPSGQPGESRGSSRKSTAPLLAPTAPPRRSASSWIMLKFLASLMPRPPDTMTSASARFNCSPSSWTISITEILLARHPWLTSTGIILPLREESMSRRFITRGRTVAICGLVSGQTMVAIILPPNAGRVWSRGCGFPPRSPIPCSQP